MKYGSVVLTAGFTGLLSFCLLAVAIGTDYWYIIDVNKPNYTGPDDLSSHSGLWRINEGKKRSSFIPTFTANMSTLSEAERQLLGLFTLSGVSIYIKYSNQAMEEFQQIVPPENLVYVDVSFGWSLATAWLSYSLEVATGLLLMLAARIIQMKGNYDSGVTITVL
ncbi:transmembrane protein 235-like isoform X2 [Mugil cephalus]|uniref:transmembrane protein 235-like isoform X2 n=1 Tax=Mugil cephalus TaxID=48193 RepID=UPI001FB62CCC|nr:transmembrane protein 235-like isoform X2 [Mugil cephalus]